MKRRSPKVVTFFASSHQSRHRLKFIEFHLCSEHGEGCLPLSTPPCLPSPKQGLLIELDYEHWLDPLIMHVTGILSLASLLGDCMSQLWAWLLRADLVLYCSLSFQHTDTVHQVECHILWFPSFMKLIRRSEVHDLDFDFRVARCQPEDLTQFGH